MRSAPHGRRRESRGDASAEKVSARRPRREYWTIARHRGTRLEVFTVEEALPVFSFEEEAEMFLDFRADEGREGWELRETTSGELASLLIGHLAKVESVILDPILFSDFWRADRLVSVPRDLFVESLLGN
ncbi:MAG: hypothetical protein ACRDSJ_00770 [Rubrobacteraceae bacterium]